MSFAVKSLSIYSFNGECRTINFKVHGVNIITGGAKTGKSSIIDIIDYCLGRKECYVADGVIREIVSWFAVLLEKDGDQLFIARRNPPRNRSTDPNVFIRRGKIDVIPGYSDLQNVIPVEELGRLVTRFAGIAENEHRPVTGTRRPLSANISHALFLCFQKQDEIASRDRLFHRQGEPFILDAIKDTLPYFLGAVDQEHFLHQRELDAAQGELRGLEAHRDSLRASAERALSHARQFILDGKRAGLVDEGFETSDPQIALQELQRVARTNTISDPEIFDSSSLIANLQNELQMLRERLIDVQNDIRATRYFSPNSQPIRERLPNSVADLPLSSCSLAKRRTTTHVRFATPPSTLQRRRRTSFAVRLPILIDKSKPLPLTARTCKRDSTNSIRRGSGSKSRSYRFRKHWIGPMSTTPGQGFCAIKQLTARE